MGGFPSNKRLNCMPMFDAPVLKKLASFLALSF